MELERSSSPEILDQDRIPEKVRIRSYRELTFIHSLLGNTRYLVSALKSDPCPIHRILDVGCGRGGLLEQLTRQLSVRGVGVDLSPPKSSRVSIIKADASVDPLPQADVAFSTYVAHHISAPELVQMIRNVGKSARRFILLDVVRDRIPLVLFKLFIAPFVSSVTAADGQTSIRRAYKPNELECLVVEALSGTNATFVHKVSLFGLRQVVDISYLRNATRTDV